MAKLDFPSSPTDGQVYAAPNGANYTWNDSVGVWTAKTAEPLNLVNPGYISGTPQVGQTLAYAEGSATGGVPPYVYTWTWKKASDGSNLQTGGATYVVPSELIGDNVYVELVVTDSLADTDSGVTNVFPFGTTISAAPFPNSLFLPVGAPNASPPEVSTATLHGTGTCSSWEDGFTTLFSTGGILFSVNSGAFGTGGTNVSDGDTVDVIWDVAVVAAASDGQVLTGTLSDGTYVNVYTLTVTRGTVTGLEGFANLVDQPLSTAVTSDVVTPEGFNVPVTFAFAGSATPLTSLGISVSGGAFSASPQTVIPGDTLQLQGTTGGSNSTAYGVDITMGSPAATQTWTVTTTAVTPAIAQPSITSPANGTTDLNPAVNSPAGIQLVGSDYDPLNGAGDPQTSSQWEVYEGGYPLTSTNTITGVTTNSPSWTNSVYGSGTGNSSGICYNGSYWFVVSDAGIYRTADFTTWTNVSAFPGSGAAGASAVNGSTVIFINGTNVTRSTDSTNFSNVANQLPNASICIAYGGGKWIVAGQTCMSYSTDDGASWTRTTNEPSGFILGVAYGAGKWVAVTLTGNVWNSTTGLTWTDTGVTIARPRYYGNSLQFLNGNFVVGSESAGTISYSSDGTTWNTSAPAISLSPMSEPAFLNGTYYISNEAGYIYESTTLSSWSFVSTLAGSPLISSMTAANGILVAAKSVSAGSGTGDVTYSGAPSGSTTLTIAGCQTDGFLVGDLVVSNPAAAGPATILSLDDSQVTTTPDTNWAIGQRIERDPASYTAVTGSPFSVTAAPFTTLTVPQADLTVSSNYYARVQYATTNATAATSEWSAWSEFGTASEFLIPPGSAMEGGYFAGQINDGGIIYNLIVAPAATGQYGGTFPSTIQWKTSASPDTNPNSQNVVYGKLATDQFTGPNYPAFDWAKSLTIGGFTDWYIPAKNELDIIYYNLKPTTSSNNTSTGINPNAVPARASNYTASIPAQTLSTLFQTGGGESFATGVSYWTSSENPSTPINALEMTFGSGYSGPTNKDSLSYARAIRRIPA